MALQQKLAVLAAAVLIHATTAVTRQLIALIEHVVLFLKTQRTQLGAKVGMLTPGAPLTARRLEVGYRQTYRYAGLAADAVRAIGVHAAAAKAQMYQFSIHGSVDQVIGGCHQGTRHAIGQIGAAIGGGHIKLQLCRRGVIGPAHALPSAAGVRNNSAAACDAQRPGC